MTYFGWEETTVFGHTIYAMTVGQYDANKALGCFQFYEFYRAACRASSTDLGALLGDPLFTKPLGVASYTIPSPPLSISLPWASGEEIVFALRVYQGDGSAGDNQGPQ